MSAIRKYLVYFKVSMLTTCVVFAFIMSSLGWRQIESSESTRVIVAAILLFIVYALIVFELVNRNLAALIGAAIAVAAYDCLVGLVSIEEIIQWEDLETLSLLFGMMIIVNVLSSTGLFDFLAVWSYKKSNGRFWFLITIMSLITVFASALIDNVSTMLLMSPTLIKLSELEHIDPRYTLMIMTIASNIGGCATPVGDPPNLIIIGNDIAGTVGITFGSFVCYCAPCVLITLICINLYLKLVYKSKESFRMKTLPEDGISIEETKRSDLSSHLSACANSQRRSSRLDDEQIDELLELHSIKSKPILIQSLTVLTITVLLFFVQSLPNTNLTLGWISLFAGLTLLVVSSSSTIDLSHEQTTNQHQNDGQATEESFDAVINKIEWPTLMFFFALFIVMEVMEKLGLIMFMGNSITSLIDLIPPGQLQSIGAITTILWASGFSSAVIDNVPFTSMMVKVLNIMIVQARSLDRPQTSIKPLVFALAFGTCFGGNGTLIGASANLVTAGIATRYGYPINFNAFFKFAAPITILTLVIANIYLVVVFVLLKY